MTGATEDPSSWPPLRDRGPLALPPDQVAPWLLGSALFSRSPDGTLVGGIIVEVEAYLAEGDSAAHGRRGRTRLTAPLFGHAGTLYVHPMRQHVGLDIVTETEGRASSVLIRALEPCSGLEEMRRRRGVEPLAALASGPARLCQALGVRREWSGSDLIDPEGPLALHVRSGGIPLTAVDRTPRIGLSRAVDLPLRFAVARNSFVSRRSVRFSE